MANFGQVEKGMCKSGVSFNWASKLRLEASAVARRCLHCWQLATSWRYLAVKQMTKQEKKVKGGVRFTCSSWAINHYFGMSDLGDVHSHS